VGQPVVLAFGPDRGRQALYYTNLTDGGQVRRIAYTGDANRPPVARAAAVPTSGPLPLTVRFDAATSADPDGDRLAYEWDFGDGSPAAAGVRVSHTYRAAGTFAAMLTVSDGRGGTGEATIRIDAGNRAPRPAIEAPTPDARFRVGQRIVLRGRATDPEDGALGSNALSWEVVRHHGDHTHPFLPPTRGDRAEITAPIPEDLASAGTSYLEVRLTATDSAGLSRTVVQALRPNVVALRFATEPGGLALRVQGTAIEAPFTVRSWEGYRLRVAAPDQRDDAGRPMEWVGWSDGGARAHTITTPGAAAAYTARFREPPAP
jgi:hypothetical protein